MESRPPAHVRRRPWACRRKLTSDLTPDKTRPVRRRAARRAPLGGPPEHVAAPLVDRSAVLAVLLAGGLYALPLLPKAGQRAVAPARRALGRRSFARVQPNWLARRAPATWGHRAARWPARGVAACRASSPVPHGDPPRSARPRANASSARWLGSLFTCRWTRWWLRAAPDACKHHNASRGRRRSEADPLRPGFVAALCCQLEAGGSGQAGRGEGSGWPRGCALAVTEGRTASGRYWVGAVRAGRPKE